VGGGVLVGVGPGVGVGSGRPAGSLDLGGARSGATSFTALSAYGSVATGEVSVRSDGEDGTGPVRTDQQAPTATTKASLAPRRRRITST
jgi:hypothetical protein